MECLDKRKNTDNIMENIFEIAGAKFFLPNHNIDSIQFCMSQKMVYWDILALYIIDKYIPEHSTILDIGANIGSHSVYWSKERKARKVYAFEPLDTTYKILTTNIQLNCLEETIIHSQYGLYNRETNARILHYWENNIGGTSFAPDDNGLFKLKTLDSLNIQDKIDLIKIDVEGLEVETLEGALETIKANKPVLVIESFTHKEEVENILFPIGYELTETIREGEDYIYTVKQ